MLLLPWVVAAVTVTEGRSGPKVEHEEEEVAAAEDEASDSEYAPERRRRRSIAGEIRDDSEMIGIVPFKDE